MSQLTFTRCLVLLLIVVGVFFTELGGARLWDRDEPRNSRASQEMLARGDWVVPTFNGELRTHKPILLYWGQMLSYLTLGESEFAARLPSALSALLAIAAVALLASRLSGHGQGISHEGYWAAGALATCLLFVMAGRAATPDACLIAFSTIGIAALVLSSLAPAAPYSNGAVRAARWLPAVFGYAMLGVAALAKGPVGIILPIAVVNIWWLICYQLQRQASAAESDSKKNTSGWTQAAIEWAQFAWRTFNPVRCLVCVWQMKMIPGMLIALIVCAPWYYQVGVATDGEFLRGFFLEHNLGRATGSMEGHGGSIFFYPVAFLVGSFPWSLWLIPVIAWCGRESKASVVHRQTIVLAGVWMSVYIGAFTIASTKLPSYITPCYAGAALVIGCYLRHFELGWSLPSRAMRLAAYGVTVVTGLGITGVLLYLSSQEAMPLLQRASLCGGVIVVVGVVAFVLESRDAIRWVPTTWLIGGACFQAILFGFGAKSVDSYRGDLQLLADVKQSTQAVDWLSIGGMEPSWVFYLEQNIVEVRENPRNAETWETITQFLNAKPDGKLIVVGADANEQLHRLQAKIAGSEAQLVEHGRTRRFLREGDMVVYGLQPRVDQVASVAPSTVGKSSSDHGEPDSKSAELESTALTASQTLQAGTAEEEPILRVGRLPSVAPAHDGGFANPLRPSGAAPIER